MGRTVFLSPSMYLHRLRLAAALAATILLAGNLPALACACCSWPTQRYSGTDKLEPHRRDEIVRLNFAADAKLLLGEANDWELPGLKDPEEDWTLGVTRQSERLTFSLKDGKRNGGTLRFGLPKMLGVALIDTRDGEDKGHGPMLYTEWTLQAPYRGEGIFRSGRSRELKLILQGRGSSCTSAESFTHWTLTFGADDRFTFYGTLAAPAD